MAPSFFQTAEEAQQSSWCLGTLGCFLVDFAAAMLHHGFIAPRNVMSSKTGGEGCFHITSKQHVELCQWLTLDWRVCRSCS